VPALALRLYYLRLPTSTADTRKNHDISLSVVCAQLQLAYVILAGSATLLKAFLAVYEPPDSSGKVLTSHQYDSGLGYQKSGKSQQSYPVYRGQNERQRRSSDNESDTKAMLTRQPPRTTSQTEIEMLNIAIVDK
jgi:hypothetical protein